MARKFDVEGLDEVLKALNGLEKLPQKCVTKSAKAGARIAWKAAIANAPYKTGLLRDNISLRAEKTKIKGKKVYDISFEHDDGFIKITKNGDRYFYPMAQEYGFRTKDGGKVEGLHFMRNALTSNKNQIEKTMVEVLAKEIDKL